MINTYTSKRHILVLFAISITILCHAQPKLVGMMYSGGADGQGTIIQYTGGDTFITTVDSLTITASPGVTLTEGPNGKLYGTTSYGDSTPYGAIIVYDYATNSYSIAAKFTTLIGGYQGSGSLLLASNGLFYCMSYNGGYYSSGALFSYDINTDSITFLTSLPNRSWPRGSLIQASDGNLYGMTESDGGYNNGSVFCYHINQNGYYSDYYFLQDENPTGTLVQAGADTFYGVMPQNLIIGQSSTIFRFVPPSSYQDVYGSSDELNPNGALLLASTGLLYGTNNFLFSYNPNTGILDTLYDLGSIGYCSNLYQASDGNIYGMTTAGGANNQGFIFQYNISTSTFTQELSLNNATGDNGYIGHLVEYITVSHHITSQIASQTVCLNDTAFFFAIDSSTYPVSAQWQVSMDSGHTYTIIADSIASTYSFVASASLNGSMYRVIFSSGDTSAPALLTVVPASTSSQSPAICAGSSLAVGTFLHNTPGTYIDTLFGASVHGCDSIVTTYLSIWAPDTFSQSLTACYISGYSIDGHVHAATGVYIDTLSGMGSHGCDSIVTTNLAIWPLDTFSQNQAVCNGDSFTINSHIYGRSGIYIDTILGAGLHGCDSIVTTALTVWPPDTFSQDQYLCHGQIYTINSHNYSSAGIYTDTLAASGIHYCDSIVITNIVMLDSIQAYFTLQPSGTPHLWYIINQCIGPSALSYTWSWGDSTANSIGDTASHTYASAGYYNVCVTVSDSEGCTASYCDTNVYLYKNQSGQMVQVEVLPHPNGIDDISNYRFSLYPNPAQGSFTIVHNYSGAINIKVADVLGAVVRQFDTNGTREGFDISGFAPGLYIISLATDAGEILKTFKLVKE